MSEFSKAWTTCQQVQSNGPMTTEWATKGLSLLIKCNKGTSCTTVTSCQTTWLGTKSSSENIRQSKMFLCKWTCKQKRSFKSMRTNYGNRSETFIWTKLKGQKSGPYADNTLYSPCKELGEVAGTSFCRGNKSASTLIPLLWLFIALFSCTDNTDCALYTSLISASLPYLDLSCF